ncbi:hypothetical protein CKAN_01903200 [Cinnamomum micranthum f. kanehirae]|uniref:Uncharacterized protein n=1 Tax=Cinnamomum micranthum f. kanehirae TaxID=337451 RepID=A0A3S3MUE1_9MAGN|nr:hypothetical protein CKAN_01903200 [Cinnamomum micranthum f. kanehirae]
MAQVDNGEQTKSETKIDNRLQLAAPRSFRPTIPTWAWVLGSVATLTLPFWAKWTRILFKLGGAVEKVVENAAEAVENAAEMAEKVLEEVANELPMDGQLKDVILLAECATKEIAKDAELAISFMHKVDGFIKQEEEMPNTPNTDQEQPEGKEAKDS